MYESKDSSLIGRLYSDTLHSGGDMTACIKCIYTVFLDTAFYIPIMRTSFLRE